MKLLIRTVSWLPGCGGGVSRQGTGVDWGVALAAVMERGAAWSAVEKGGCGGVWREVRKAEVGRLVELFF